MDSNYRKDLVKTRKIFAIIQITILPGQVIQLISLTVFRTGLHTCYEKGQRYLRWLFEDHFSPMSERFAFDMKRKKFNRF